MTSDRDIERVLDRWFAEGPTHLPDHLFDVVVGRIDRVQQRRLARLQTRLFPRNFNLRYAAAAAMVVVLIAAGLGLAVLIRAPGVAAGPSASPSSSAAAPAVIGPTALQSTWSSMGTREHPYAHTTYFARADIVIGPTSLTIPAVSTDLLSSVSFVGPDTFEVTVVSGPGQYSWKCQLGDVGSYSFSLSSGGSAMTLTPVRDACPGRAAVLTGDWVRTEVGRLAPGRHVSPLFRPFGGSTGQVSYTVPAGWADQYECESCFQIGRASDPAYPSIVLFTSALIPDTVAQNCHGTSNTIGSSVGAIANWLTTIPGLVATTPTTTTIGGFSGVMVDLSIAPGWANPCEPGQLVHTFSDPTLLITDSGHARYILLDLDGGRTLLIDVEGQDSASFDAFIRDAMPIIDSFEFTR
jgi:hypothetical protein